METSPRSFVMLQVVQEITRRSTGKKYAPSPYWRATSRRRAAVRFWGGEVLSRAS